MIRMIQYNCARSYEGTTAVLETVVERRVDIVSLQEPPRERGEIGISHSPFHIRKTNGVSTAIRKGSALVVDQRTDLSRGANDDVLATDVRRTDEKITRIINIDDQKTARLGERERSAGKLIRKRVIRPGGIVLAGDFNAHSKQLDPRSQV
jgi:hypothetical protein